MKTFLKTLLLVALLAGPGFASTIYSNRGDMTTADDEVRYAVNPTLYGSVKATTYGSFVGAATYEYTNDNKNWKAAPYATRLDATAANPTFALTSTTSSVYEIPVPGDAVTMRIRFSTATSGTMHARLEPFRPYVPHTVHAVVYNSATTSTTTSDTGILWMTGWTSADLTLIAAATTGTPTGFGKLYDISEDGNYTGATQNATSYIGTSHSTTAPGNLRFLMGMGRAPFADAAMGDGYVQSLGYMPRRIEFKTSGNDNGGVATTATLVRVVAHR